MLIVDVMPDGKLVECYHEAVLTRLGEGLGASGNLLPAAADRTLDAVRSFVGRVREAGADVAGITTSVLRRADDGKAFRARFQAIAGAELRVLTGNEEAAFSFRGATYGTSHAQRIAVLDIGGGSTECAVGISDVEQAISIEIGAVRLTEMFSGLSGRSGSDAARSDSARARSFVDQQFSAAFANLRADLAMAVAGTPRTIRAIADCDDGAYIDGSTLSQDAANDVLELLLASDLVSRRELRGMTPPRADILAGGAIIYCATLRALALSSARVTRNDLLIGYLRSDRPPAFQA